MTTFLLILSLIFLSAATIMFFLIKSRDALLETSKDRIKQLQSSLLNDQAEYKLKIDGSLNTIKQNNEANQQHIDDLVKTHKKELGHWKAANTVLKGNLRKVRAALNKQLEIHADYEEAKNEVKPITSDTNPDIIDGILSNG